MDSGYRERWKFRRVSRMGFDPQSETSTPGFSIIFARRQYWYFIFIQRSCTRVLALCTLCRRITSLLSRKRCLSVSPSSKDGGFAQPLPKATCLRGNTATDGPPILIRCRRCWLGGAVRRTTRIRRFCSDMQTIPNCPSLEESTCIV